MILAQSTSAPGLPVVEQAVHWVARGLELAGIAVLVGGVLLATGLFVRRWLGGTPFGDLYHPYRAGLGRAVLLGLEFLVAADIIGTVAVEPTFHSLGLLAVVVLIRTFLSFALEVEIDGHWPWKDSEYAQKEREDRL